MLTYKRNDDDDDGDDDAYKWEKKKERKFKWNKPKNRTEKKTLIQEETLKNIHLMKMKMKMKMKKKKGEPGGELWIFVSNYLKVIFSIPCFFFHMFIAIIFCGYIALCLYLFLLYMYIMSSQSLPNTHIVWNRTTKQSVFRRHITLALQGNGYRQFIDIECNMISFSILFWIRPKHHSVKADNNHLFIDANVTLALPGNGYDKFIDTKCNMIHWISIFFQVCPKRHSVKTDNNHLSLMPT